MGAFYDPHAGGIRTPNPELVRTRGEFEGARGPLMHARARAGKGLPAQQSRPDGRIAEGVEGCPLAGALQSKA